MLFPTHLLLGVGLGRGRFPTAWIVAGAALPDLVDKPLAMLGLIQTYHSVTHSAWFGLVFAVLLVLTRWTDWRLDTTTLASVALGWGSHLGADAVHITLNGRPENTVFLLWPVVDSWNSIGVGPGAFFQQYIGTTSFYVELVVWLCIGSLLLRDTGLPHPRTGE